MIIDTHTHIFPEAIAHRAISKLSANEGLHPYTEGTATSLLRSSKKAGIGLNIVLPVVTKPTQTRDVCEEAIKTNEEYEKGCTSPALYSFGGIHPDNEDYKEVLNTLYSNGIKGIKLHPVFQLTYFDDIKYMRIIDHACSLGMVINVHAGRDITLKDAEFSDINHIIPVLKTLNPPKLILAHMGGWNSWDNAEEMLDRYKPYIDTSFSHRMIDPYPSIYKPLSDEQMLRLMSIVGFDHVLFGTDSPWTNQKDSLDILKGIIKDDEKFSMVTESNAQKLTLF